MHDKMRSDEDASRNGGEPEQDPPERPEEFSSFEALARRLVQVPKAELDAKRKTAKA
jgi:hypothetical protein